MDKTLGQLLIESLQEAVNMEASSSYGEFNKEFNFWQYCPCYMCKTRRQTYRDDNNGEDWNPVQENDNDGWQSLNSAGDFPTFDLTNIQGESAMNVLDRIASQEITITIAEFGQLQELARENERLKNLQSENESLNASLQEYSRQIANLTEDVERNRRYYQDQVERTNNFRDRLNDVQLQLTNAKRDRPYVENNNPQLVNVYRELLRGDSELGMKVAGIIEDADGKIPAIKKVREDLYPGFVLGVKEAKELVEDVLASWGYTNTEQHNRYFDRNKF